eukprot:2018451-Rhodomonas_salina.1
MVENPLDAIREGFTVLKRPHVAVGVLTLDLVQVNQVHLPGAVGCEERDAEPDDTLEVVAHAPLAEVQY